ncbi:aminomethyl-transferring glycine dehydrogenase [Aquirufa nivalisilvae]|uniref:Glycine dehydrogenase (decarboxylating) n=1 Tax=Aquirufa nivalisilvae TaxID=2516557 RepID=A0A2S2DYY4_9BACT|nr:aminomethyl-transferring glycine dehydrogenase [Aquirufa nivalisilvae]AWL09987.1 Glycine dehydrogenase (aminomethyl-transferring) [Aquirufa nivalisilvae]MCZ2480616.1 aminomethyl-transferring glycine dehydrogenase [Aquirufa nivalisilvae]MCZ2482854.1 aminomethyl-transferring glycine dehydrogenase [Aquirufa nivalisilvae]TBH70954.1 glycine dehydrogenase (aminomethyl-transferring) [Aquirufa nivalisilvae]
MIPNFKYREDFSLRHNNSNPTDIAAMLKTIGVDSLTTLIQQTVPQPIRLPQGLRLPNPKTEFEFLRDFKQIMGQNKIFKSHIGLGYYDTIVPSVILRNILENPSWYTAYTPYQAEIAQGRLEMLLNYQTMIIDLTGMELANASLLDEGTAAAEAMTMLHGQRPAERNQAESIFVSELCLPQTIDVLKTRAEPLGINVVVGNHLNIDVTDAQYYAIVLQYPASNGEVFDYTALIESAKENGLQVVVAADLLALTILTPPGEMGADVVVGSSQRFGVPMGFGGPHAAFFATKEKYKRNIPGRIIGVSIDAEGNRALRMALQTREQHIRREKATSNICTAQVLLSIMAAAYAIYHGPEELKNKATKIYGLTELLAAGLQKLGFSLENTHHFDTITVITGEYTEEIRELAEDSERNFRYFRNDSSKLSISLDETTQEEDVVEILGFFQRVKMEGIGGEEMSITWRIPAKLTRQSAFLSHEVFNRYHSEHGMLRYLKSLESKDLSMVHSMISLGSCTMKLNATTEMIPVTWPELGKIHPFAPASQTRGYQRLIMELNDWLCEITGFAAMSMQPNSGAQGEYAGLMVIRAYHASRGDSHRNVALIPSSAHGTNPASAVMAGMKVIVTGCDANGNIDVEQLRAKAIEHKDDLACLMVTYPSTHGVFEESIKEICKIIHENGGQVYMDGANMNAQVGLTSPATIGADVCHLNLHKTFCIPHGGGGPGMGPIGVAKQLVPFLPGHVMTDSVEASSHGAVSAGPVGSASILAISYAYIAMMGGEGLTRATETAILNANYIKARLETKFPILYTGSQGRCAHEMIVDCRPFKASVGIEAEDIAKRLMDYGFHAPTLSFPVAGTLMIEPTESENKEELDRFCDALLSIRAEIQEIEDGQADKLNNVLKNAPHTQSVVLIGEWNRPYSREKAVFPLAYVKANKFWPSVSRIDSAYGDRNLVCACEPITSYMEQ